MWLELFTELDDLLSHVGIVGVDGAEVDSTRAEKVLKNLTKTLTMDVS